MLAILSHVSFSCFILLLEFDWGFMFFVNLWGTIMWVYLNQCSMQESTPWYSLHKYLLLRQEENESNGYLGKEKESYDWQYTISISHKCSLELYRTNITNLLNIRKILYHDYLLFQTDTNKSHKMFLVNLIFKLLSKSLRNISSQNILNFPVFFYFKVFSLILLLLPFIQVPRIVCNWSSCCHLSVIKYPKYSL